MTGVNAADLWWLLEHQADLREMRLRGTPRAWQQAAMWTPEARAAADDAARVERAERTDAALGEHPAPMHPDVTDLIVVVLKQAHEWADKVAQAAGIERLRHPPSAYTPAEPYLRLCAQWLHQANDEDGHVGSYVQHAAAVLRAEVENALGELSAGQTIQALCPFCHGGADQRFTLRVRMHDDEAYLRCESGTCEPGHADCGTWIKGLPAWSIAREGEWIAQRIEHAEAAADTAA